MSETSDLIGELATVRDFIRYASSLFARSNLTYGHGTLTPVDEAVFMVLEGLYLPVCEPADAWLDAKLTQKERLELISMIHARAEVRFPAPYLLNKAYIGGVPFYVDERVIIPRSYIGEMLTGEGLSFLEEPERIGRVLDLCTGSGCLAILAARLFPDAEIDAVDLSTDALDVARRNLDMHGLENRIRLMHGDLFAPVEGRTYDLIITNPPYVDAAGMADLPPEYRREPEMALAGGEDGMDIVRRILKEAPAHLNPGGGLLCEFGTGREILERDYPRLPFLWLDTQNSEGETFWLPAGG